MNILTLGLVIQRHSLDQLSSVGKIVSLANKVLPEDHQINKKTTGLELVSIYRSLSPETQQMVYNHVILDRTEVNFLYQEVKYLSEGEMLKHKYTDTRTVNLFMTLLFMHLFVASIVVVTYRLNTSATGDLISANFTEMIYNLFKYVVTGII